MPSCTAHVRFPGKSGHSVCSYLLSDPKIINRLNAIGTFAFLVRCCTHVIVVRPRNSYGLDRVGLNHSGGRQLVCNRGNNSTGATLL